MIDSLHVVPTDVCARAVLTSRLSAVMTDRPAKRALEYLFYAIKWPWGQDQATYVHAGNEVQRIAEEGFTSEHCESPAPIPPLPPGYLDAAAKPSFAVKNRRFKPAVCFSHNRARINGRSCFALLSRVLHFRSCCEWMESYMGGISVLLRFIARCFVA